MASQDDNAETQKRPVLGPSQVADKFRAIADGFEVVCAEATKSEHAKIGIQRVSERAGKLLVSRFEAIKGLDPAWPAMLRREREKQRSGVISAFKPDMVWDIVAKCTAEDCPESFNEGDHNLLSDHWAGCEIIPWPDWYDEMTDDERLRYEEMADQNLLGKGVQVPKRGHDVRRPKPKPIPNRFSTTGEQPGDDADRLALYRERGRVHAIVCRLLADIADGTSQDDAPSDAPPDSPKSLVFDASAMQLSYRDGRVDPLLFRANAEFKTLSRLAKRQNMPIPCDRDVISRLKTRLSKAGYNCVAESIDSKGNGRYLMRSEADIACTGQ